MCFKPRPPSPTAVAVSAASEKIEDDLTALPASLEVVEVKFDTKRPDALLLEYFGRAEDGLIFVPLDVHLHEIDRLKPELVK